VVAADGGVAFAVGSLAVGAVLSGFVLGSHLPEAFAVTDRALGVGLTYGIGSAVFGGLAPLAAQRLAVNGHLGAIAAFPFCCAVLAGASLAWAARRPDTPESMPVGSDGSGLDRPASRR
jgi:hypothetical protein